MQIAPMISTSPESSDAASSQALGKEEFLRLLVTQLANQDPLNPLDDKQFIAQLAQFSSLEQLVQSNQNLALIGASQTAVVNAQMSALIGNEVVASGDALAIAASGSAPPLSFTLEGEASRVTIRILDEEGRAVRTIEAGAMAAGPQTRAWDGLSDTGAALPAGSYRVEIEAVDAGGQTVGATSRVRGVVTGVSFESGHAELLLGELRVRPADVIEVHSAF